VIGGIFLAELLLVGGGLGHQCRRRQVDYRGDPNNVSNTEALGLVLYTRYITTQIAGMVLLVAMIGAIRADAAPQGQRQAQDINVQNAADARTAMSLRKVASPGACRTRTRRSGCNDRSVLDINLSVGAMLFTLGILGIFLNRKNIIVNPDVDRADLAAVISTLVASRPSRRHRRHRIRTVVPQWPQRKPRSASGAGCVLRNRGLDRGLRTSI